MDQENKGILMNKYEVGRLLGKGTFAKVYYARNTTTSQCVAIKVINKEKVLKVGLIDQIKREISAMKLVKHPNVVQLYEVMATKTKIYFVLEYVKGVELFNKVAKGKLEEDVARKYFQQLISVVDFCHSQGIYHRDLKPENLLIDENGNLKVSDFGLSALAESKRQDGLLHTTCGTPAYVAPEVIHRMGYDGAKADIWSCGVILFVLLAGYLPFRDPNLMDMYKKIAKADFKCPGWFRPDVQKLLLRILDPKPGSRIPIAKIMEHPWFKKGLDARFLIDNTEMQQPSSVDFEVSSSPVNSIVEPKQQMDKLTNLNAFDIISLSAGFDLSCLFEDTDHKREAKFTSAQPALAIITKLEDIAGRFNLKVTKKDQGVLKMERAKVERKVVLGIDAEIFEVTPSFHLVEIKMTNGDAIENQNMWKEDIRPALKDIVWVWLGEQEQQQN